MQALAGYISYSSRYFTGVRLGIITFAPRDSPNSLPDARLIVASAVVLGMFTSGHSILVRAITL